MVAMPKALNGMGRHRAAEGGTGSVGFQRFILTSMNNPGMTVSRSRVGNPVAAKIWLRRQKRRYELWKQEDNISKKLT